MPPRDRDAPRRPYLMKDTIGRKRRTSGKQSQSRHFRISFACSLREDGTLSAASDRTRDARDLCTMDVVAPPGGGRNTSGPTRDETSLPAIMMWRPRLRKDLGSNDRDLPAAFSHPRPSKARPLERPFKGRMPKATRPLDTPPDPKQRGPRHRRRGPRFPCTPILQRAKRDVP